MDYEEILVCDDCTIAIANDDYSGIDDDRIEAVKAGVERIGYAFIGEMDGFSHDKCGCCGTKLGGNRHVAYRDMNL